MHKQGQRRLVRAVVWGPTAEVPKYLAKGPSLYLMGTGKLLKFSSFYFLTA